MTVVPAGWPGAVAFALIALVVAEGLANHVAGSPHLQRARPS
jgi:hypothetical protein